MDKHGVVETQKMQAEYDASKLCSIKFEGNTDNGLVFALGDLIEGEREVYAIKDAAKTDTVEKGALVLITTPEVNNIAKERELTDFYNHKNSIGRGTILCVGDIFGATAECFTGTPEAGKFVKVSTKGKLEVADESTEAFGKILDVHNGKFGVKVLPTVTA